MATNVKNNNKSATKPDMVDVLKEVKRSVSIDLNCVNIGIIKAFDPATQTATIQLALKRVISVDDKGVKTLQERPLILKCPVMVLFGGSSFINFPIVPGDNCIVLFNDREIDNWFVNGGLQTPTTRRTHDISDAIALVGIRSLQNSIANYLANGIRISHHNGSAQMDFTDALISSVATMFLHTGNMHITGDLTIEGTTHGNSGSSNWTLDANLVQVAGRQLHDGRMCSGTFNYVTVVDGIVVSGS